MTPTKGNKCCMMADNIKTTSNRMRYTSEHQTHIIDVKIRTCKKCGQIFDVDGAEIKPGLKGEKS